MKVVVCCAILWSACCTSPALAQIDEPTLPRGDGPLLTLGVGNNYGIVGIELAYEFRVPDTLYHVAPHAGLGFVSPLALGVRGAWGLRHRIVLDLGYLPVAARDVYLHGVLVETLTLHGIAIAAGYEYVSNWGFVFRATGGLGYAVSRWSEHMTGIVVNLGIGMKLW